MYKDRQLCFLFEKEITNLNSGVIGDTLRTGWGQFRGHDMHFFIASDGPVTATGNPTLECILEYADNEDFDDSVEVKLPVKWTKTDLSGAKGYPTPTCRVPWSPPTWKEPRDVYYRLKLDCSAEFACTGKVSAGFVIDPETAPGIPDYLYDQQKKPY